MKTYKIDSTRINNWQSFHDLFAKQFNFPEYYGRNMNAWIDCIEDYVIDGITVLDFGNCSNLKSEHPEIHNAILESSAFINHRSTESGGTPHLIISMG